MSPKPSLNLAVIGNSNIASLIDQGGRFVWTCWPRIDGDPIFCALVDGHAPDRGFFAVEFDEPSTSKQSYVRNTAIVRTVIAAESGASFAITDFAPRFKQHDRLFRPPMIIRRIEPVQGICRIRVRIRPSMNYGSQQAQAIVGSNHIRYVADAGSFRITTDAPVSYVANESSFLLKRAVSFILHPDERFTDPLARTSAEYLDQTTSYWLDWVRYLSVPYEWQEAVIRAAITLKLCSFEETGAIVAALTTSIAEAAETERNWDYRYCWIRDAFFTVRALNRVGATLTMEQFIDYVTGIMAMAPGRDMKPVYGILPEEPLDEYIATSLRGYRGYGPVRVGNAAVDQTQHDAYGSVLLAASQMFFDERLPQKGDTVLFDMLETLGRHAYKSALTPDAGIWEYRGRARIHTHSAAMCWVACDRLAIIADVLGFHDRAMEWRRSADGLRETILARAWNPAIQCFAGSLDTDEIDASVLLLGELGLVAATDERYVSTVRTIGKHLGRNGYLLRYSAPDDFGEPTVTFTICTFWYVDALAAIGEVDEARRIFEMLLARRNHVGLLSEDIAPDTGELWGNFPQTYSMSGIILAATRLSKGWETAR